jgi:exonuclease SbcC
MIIQSIRLKNIRSYGEGIDGGGTTVMLEEGLNRIAGKNGCGKSTLIDSLGYALFLAEPDFEETFKVPTYFLRSGCSTGEIDVTFSCQNESYRIERGVGNQKTRREKVIQLSDGSICAEGHQEVSNFLINLLKIPSEKRLSEVFSKLIGVRQGQLTRPFDSKPTAARNFFESLLEVVIFRRCYDELKPATDHIKELNQEKVVERATWFGRMEDREDSQELLKQADRDVKNSEKTLKKETALRKKAETRRDRLKKAEKAWRDAEQARDNAAHEMTAASERLKKSTEEVKESEAATEQVKEMEPGYEAFLKAGKALKRLRQEEKERTDLELKKSEAEGDRSTFSMQKQTAKKRGDQLAKEHKTKQAKYDGKVKKQQVLANKLEDTEERFAKSENEFGELQEDSFTLKNYAKKLPATVNQLGEDVANVKELSKEIGAWDPKTLDEAKKSAGKAEKALNDVQSKYTEAVTKRKTLAEQLEQIGGGVCPFLKEKCEQFDPQKVEGDCGDLDKEIKKLLTQCKKKEATKEEAEETLKKLTKQQTHIEEKKTSINEKVQRCLKSMGGMITEEVALAVERSQKCVKHFPELPAPPHIPETADAASMRSLHDELERFAAELDPWHDEWLPLVEQKTEAFEKKRIARHKNEEALDHLEGTVAELWDELEGLSEEKKEQHEEAADAEKREKHAKNEITRLCKELEAHEGLDTQIDDQENAEKENKPHHDGYLGKKPLADQLADRKASHKNNQNDEEAKKATLKTCEETWHKKNKGFEPNKLKSAEEEYSNKNAAVKVTEERLKAKRKERTTQSGRFGEWEKACAKLKTINDEVARLEVAERLGQDARKVLKDTAPEVAQHLCNRIAVHAQEIFNQVNHEPVQLTWDAKNYGLRLEPGNRRFAMLSGGEQTKLALAMTLAMARDFSGLNFCIFDEPTYGVDADTRPLLADAILAAQEAAGLEQLLLVSHDDAFEGKIEHAILLEKSAATGTRLAQIQ